MKQHLGRCFSGTDGCFGCGNMGPMMRNCPKLKAKGKEVNKSPYGGSDPNAWNKNRFYALRAKAGANPDEGPGK